MERNHSIHSSSNNELIYENILRSMNNGVIALDYEGKIITFNDAAASILGIKVQDALGRYYPEVFFTLSGNDEFNDALINAIFTKETYLYKEVTFIKNTRIKVPLSLTCSLLKDYEGNDYGIVAVFSDLTDVQKRKFLQDTLTRYVTKQVVDVILEHPENIVLDGEEKETTILFTDIRGFTGIAERMLPRKLVHMLREYFTLIVQIAFRFNGTVDKFIGDSVMVIFGAPQPEKKHAELAVNAALEMQEKMKGLNKNFKKEGYEPIKIGIGICSGKVVVGNVGSKDRLEYTAIGDSVNLASRLEGTNKVYGTRIIISETTYQAIKDRVFVRELDRVRVKGKNEPITIYEVCDKNENISQKKKKIVELFKKGVLLYRKRSWQEAISHFENILAIQPLDMPSLMYCRRCKKYMQHAPPDSWDGVYNMQSK